MTAVFGPADPSVMATDLLRELHRRDTEIWFTLSGHDHLPGPCTRTCPLAGYGREAVQHVSALAHAAGWPHDDPTKPRVRRYGAECNPALWCRHVHR